MHEWDTYHNSASIAEVRAILPSLETRGVSYVKQQKYTYQYNYTTSTTNLVSPFLPLSVGFWKLQL